MALSVGDILTALVYIPTHIINVNVSLDVPCNGLGIEQFFTIFLGTSATILTTIICMDRYIFISRPCQRMLSSPSSPSNQRRHSTRKIFIVYCIVTYSISFSFSITSYQNITLNNSEIKYFRRTAIVISTPPIIRKTLYFICCDLTAWAKS